jgi:nucleoid-associated protein YgaU
VVAAGDSLWRIAKSLLPPSASDAEITRTWQAIYFANRSTIGTDPGLIFPGQVFTLPAEVLR